MVLPSADSPDLEDEFIYIKDDDKNVSEDDEMEILAPILIEGALDDIILAPRDLTNYLKPEKPDDATESTSPSISDLLMLSSIDAPSIHTVETSENDGSTFGAFVSFSTEKDELSPRSEFVSKAALRLPSDVLFDGHVAFSNSAAPVRRIHLQPRNCANVESIFTKKAIMEEESITDRRFALADSISSFDDYDGAEERKDEDDERCREDEGFAYVYYGDGFENTEEKYWGGYGGHYGSHENSFGDYRDYAFDHPSVKSTPSFPSGLQFREFKRAHSGSPDEYLDDLYELFQSFFACTSIKSLPSARHHSPAACKRLGYAFGPSDYKRLGNGFGPADYGVARRSQFV